MPERILPILDAIFMTVVSWGLFAIWMSLLTTIPPILASLYWMGKIKNVANKNHGGSVIKYLMYLVKKN